MSKFKFIGRDKELKLLQTLLHRDKASLVIIKGRRRIGKSTLVEQFSKNLSKFYKFSGLPPTPHVTSHDQRQDFVYQMHQQGIPGIAPDDWSNIFWHLAKNIKRGRVLIFLDEISWMGSKDPLFLSKLKTAWDQFFKHNPNLILILCGSVSSWIEDNLLSSTGFLGRPTLLITLEELPLYDCNEFWGLKKNRISSYEKFKFLAITGGVPRYLEELRPELPAEKNLQRLCFTKEGVLFNEFDRIFSDLFERKAKTLKKITRLLTNGNKDIDTLFRELKLKKSGAFIKYLNILEKSGFVSREHTWQIAQKKVSKLSHFRLRDNYLRFYLKYIEPHRQKIEVGLFENINISSLPGWDSIMGYQFENLVLNNRRKLHQLLNIADEQVLFANPFFQSQKKTQRGCQIDYLIHTSFNTFYLCEIKFSKNPIGNTIINEIENKIHNLKKPRHFSVRPVLIHVNGVQDSIVDSGYFDHIIDFSSLLQSQLGAPRHASP